MLKWVRGEPLSQDHWLDLFRLLGMPRGTTLEKLTFGDILGVSDAIVINANALKVSSHNYNYCESELKMSRTKKKNNSSRDFVFFSFCLPTTQPMFTVCRS